MPQILTPLGSSPFEQQPAGGTARREAEIIAGRVASARHWRRRRRVLRVRAALFGRRKLARGGACDGTPARRGVEAAGAGGLAGVLAGGLAGARSE